MKRFFTSLQLKHYSYSISNNVLLRDALRKLQLSEDKQALVYKQMDTLLLTDLEEYAKLSKEKRYQFPSDIRHYFDSLLFQNYAFCEYFSKYVEKEEEVIQPIMDYSSVFVDEDIDSVIRWERFPLVRKKKVFAPIYKLVDIAIMKQSGFFKAVSLDLEAYSSELMEHRIFDVRDWIAFPFERKQMYFANIYQMIDHEILKTSVFFKQTNHLFEDKGVRLFDYASKLITMDIFQQFFWYESQDIQKIFELLGSYANTLKIGRILEKQCYKVEPRTLSQLLQSEKAKHQLEFEEFVSRENEMVKLFEFTSKNEKAFHKQSILPQDWGILNIFGASGVGKTRLAHSFVERYNSTVGNCEVFDICAKQNTKLSFLLFDISAADYLKLLVFVAMFERIYKLEALMAYPLQLVEALKNDSISLANIIDAARIIHQIDHSKRIDLFIRIDEFQSLFSKNQIDRTSSKSYSLCMELIHLCTSLAAYNVFVIPIVYGTWTLETPIMEGKLYPSLPWQVYSVPLDCISSEQAELLILNKSPKMQKYISNQQLTKLFTVFGAFGRLIVTIKDALQSFQLTEHTTEVDVFNCISLATIKYFKDYISLYELNAELLQFVFDKSSIHTMSESHKKIVQAALVDGSIMMREEYISCSLGIIYSYFKDELQISDEQLSKQMCSWIANSSRQPFDMLIPHIIAVKYANLLALEIQSTTIKKLFKGWSPESKLDVEITVQNPIQFKEVKLKGVLTAAKLHALRQATLHFPTYVHFTSHSQHTCDGAFLFDNCTVLVQYRLKSTKESDIPIIVPNKIYPGTIRDHIEIKQYPVKRNFIRCQYNALYAELHDVPNLFYYFVCDEAFNKQQLNADGTAKPNNVQVVDPRTIILNLSEQPLPCVTIPKQIHKNSK